MARNLTRFLAISLLAFAAVTVAAQAQTYLIDFGAASTVTTTGLSPDDPVNTWNNVTDAIGGALNGSLLNLKTTTNVTSDIDLIIISPFNSPNTNGVTNSTLYPIDATRDSLYGNTEAQGRGANYFPVFKLSMLDPLLTYNLTFYASRTDTAPTPANRETRYTAAGLTTDSVVLNATNNIDGTVTLFGMSPSALGEIQVSLAVTANNNSAQHFTYLNVLQIVTIPEPASAALLAGGAALLGLRRRRS